MPERRGEGRRGSNQALAALDRTPDRVGDEAHRFSPPRSFRPLRLAALEYVALHANADHVDAVDDVHVDRADVI
jgi:hypothetical protein